MRYPWYGVDSKFFGGIYWSHRSEGIFYSFEEAKACYDSIDIDEFHSEVSLTEFHENSCKVLFLKERKLKQPTPETMGRARYISIKGGFKNK